MKDLQFSTAIAAPAARVWDRMFDPIAYRDWTSAFAEGSCFEGVWAAGHRLRFLDPRGFGMAAVVDECLPHERLSLRLVGEIRDGRPVADSPLGRTPAFERYEFSPTAEGGTRLVVDLQGWDDGFTDFLQTTGPQALRRLKTLAEAAA